MAATVSLCADPLPQDDPSPGVGRSPSCFRTLSCLSGSVHVPVGTFDHSLRVQLLQTARLHQTKLTQSWTYRSMKQWYRFSIFYLYFPRVCVRVCVCVCGTHFFPLSFLLFLVCFGNACDFVVGGGFFSLHAFAFFVYRRV